MEEEPTIRDSFKKFIEELRQSWSKLNCGYKAVTWFYLVLLGPFLIEGIFVIFCLGLLIPFGFLVMRPLKHYIVPLWIVVLVVIQVGGASDQISDIVMMVKILQAFVTYKKPHIMTGAPSEVDEDTERKLLLARVIMTFVSGTPALLLIKFASGVLPTLSDQVEKKQTKRSASSNDFMGSTLFVFLGIVLWKAGMVLLRVVLLVRVIYSMIRYRKITVKVEKDAAWMESLILLDVVWSAVPLGILTAIEMIYFKHTLGYNSQEIWEIFKLSALGIDMISICYFVYFEILGLDSCGKKHHAEVESSLINGTEESALLTPASTPESNNIDTIQTTTDLEK